MKKLAKYFLAAVFTVLALGMMAGAAQAATPSLAAATAGNYYKEIQVVNGKRYWYYSLYAEIKVKNITADGEILKVQLNNQDLDYEIGEDSNHTQYLIVEYTGTKKVSASVQKVSFTLEQGSRSYTLSTRVIFRALPIRFKTLKIGNRNYLSKFPAGTKGLVSVYAGKHPKISYTMKSGYTSAGVRVQRGGKLYSYSAIAKLQKGDLILMRYRKNGSKQIYSYQIYVY